MRHFLFTNQARAERYTRPGGGDDKFSFLPRNRQLHGQMLRDELNAAAEQAVTISFNGRFLAEFAKTMPDALVTIGYNDDRNSVALWMTVEDGYEVRYVVMPCID